MIAITKLLINLQRSTGKILVGEFPISRIFIELRICSFVTKEKRAVKEGKIIFEADMFALRFPTLTSHVCIQHINARTRAREINKNGKRYFVCTTISSSVRTELSVDECMYACMRV